VIGLLYNLHTTTAICLPFFEVKLEILLLSLVSCILPESEYASGPEPAIYQSAATRVRRK
jgi:hypothetical protein